jgi:hypothetical protein
MTATKRKGLKSGTRTEFSIFAKVKPGHAKALTEVLMGGRSKTRRSYGKV